MKEFKNIIYSLRAAKGLSQKDLSKELGVGQSTVAMWESGQRIPSVQMYEQLADYFNVDLDYLHGRTDIVRKTMFDEFGNNYFPSDKKLQYLNKYYSQLNDIGQDEAVKRVRELTYIPEFKNVQLIAAHERTDIEVTDDMIKRDDELMNEDWLNLNYDELISEAEQIGLIVKEKPLQSADGRILNNKIVIRDSLDELRKKCVLAEEIGHYLKNAGDILDQRNTSNSRQEDRARTWAYDMLIGLDGLVSAFEYGCQTKFDVAEYLDVTTAFLDDALKKYKERYGIVVKYKEYFIYFYPCLAVLKK